MAYGFDDSTVVLPYTNLTKAASNSVGFSNCFSFTNPKYSDMGVTGKAWDDDLALVVEYFDGTTRTKLTKTTEWLISSNTVTLYVKPSSISDASWAAGSFTGKSITLWWRSDAGQDYSGESRLALSPQAIAAQLDKTTRMAVAAIEAANRSIQIHPSNTTAFNVDPKAIPSASAIIPPGVKGGKVLGWDSATEKLTYVVNAALGGFSEATPTTMMQRDIAGNSKVAEPTDSAHIATKNYVDNTATAVNTLRAAADATHAALTTAHGAVSTATASTIVMRDGSSRARVATPSDAQDIANKAYVDNAGGAVASFIVGSTVDNDTTFGKLFADGAVTVPVSGYTSAVDAPGTQGSLVATFNGSSPLAGTYDLKLAKGTGASIKGTGWSVDFTVSPAYLGTVWQIAFPYYMDTAALDNNWQVFVFATASIGGAVVGSVIPLSDQYLHPTTAPTPNQFFATFFPTTAVTYRLILMYTATDTTACNVNLDNVTVSRMTIPNAAAVGGWTAYTPPAGFNNLPGSWAVAQWRRVGSNIHINAKYLASGAASGAVLLSMSSLLPAGLTANMATIMFPITATKNSVTDWSGTWDGTAFYGPNGQTQWIASVPFTWASADFVSFDFTVPIAQWTTNVNLATDFTEYAWNTTLTTVSDTGGANNGYGTDGVAVQSFAPSATATVAKRVVFRRPFGPTDLPVLEFKINGTWTPIENTAYGFQANDAGTAYSGAQARPASGGVAIDVNFCNTAFPGSTWASEVSTGLQAWRVRKVSNGNMAETPPVVRAEYTYSGGAVVVGATAIFTCATKFEDTHSAYNGATGYFTAPISGVYSVELQTTASAATTSLAQFFGYIYKQAAFFKQIALTLVMPNQAGCQLQGTGTVRVLAGETISLWVAQSSNTAGNYNGGRVVFTRIGA